MRVLGVAGAFLALSACASSVGLSDKSTAVSVASGDLPAPDAFSADELVEFRIGAHDVLGVSVFNAPELQTEGQVDAGGQFDMPLVGTIRMAGRTPSEAAEAVAALLRGRFIKDPRVTVTLKEIRSSVVTIDGAVKKPGLYPVVGEMTLQRAVARAEGTGDFAKLSRVVVFRKVDGKQMAAMFDLNDIRSGRTPDPKIFGNDVVVVGESGVRRLLRDSSTGIPVLARFIPIL